jgi:isopentenyl-diphosphate delta-isomerase
MLLGHVSGGKDMNTMEGRKKDHLEIVLGERVESSYNYWDDFHFIHNALPDINIDNIDLSTQLFDKKIEAPLIMAGMTGGFSKAKKINERFAKVAEKYQIGMGVGSQRAGLEDPLLVDTYSIIKNYDIPLKIANLGAPQLIEWEDPLGKAEKAVEMIDADVLAIHLNFLQESVQVEGERNAHGCLESIQKICNSLSTPVIVKETGAGISPEVAKKICDIGIKGIDIGGRGGASFAAIEAYRAQKRGDMVQSRLGHTFWDWGIPTPYSLLEVHGVVGETLPLIATGGVRNGLDVAKSLALGASAAGMASALLKNDVTQEIDICIKELKTAMFLTGSKNINLLKEQELWM